MSPIREHGLVDLLVPGAERRAARVKAIGHGHVLLTVFGSPIGAEVGARATAATLELLGADGVARVGGTVAHGGDPRALTFRPADPALLPQRRGRPRVALDHEILLECRGGGSATGRVVDVAVGGVRFRSADAFDLHQPVDVTFTPGPGGAPLRGSGRILRADGAGEYALAFDPWPEAEHERLLALIHRATPQP